MSEENEDSADIVAMPGNGDGNKVHTDGHREWTAPNGACAKCARNRAREAESENATLGEALCELNEALLAFEPDSARLDWLEDNAVYGHIGGSWDWGVRIVYGPGIQLPKPFRAAIDAAMGATDKADE